MLVQKENIAYIVEQIQSGQACWVSVFSKTEYEVGYSVAKRFRACNPKTCKYDGKWVEPQDELVKFFDENKVCASLYDKHDFDSLLEKSGIAKTADWCDCLLHYLAEIDADLQSCLEEVGIKVKPWKEFVQHIK